MSRFGLGLICLVVMTFIVVPAASGSVYLVDFEEQEGTGLVEGMMISSVDLRNGTTVGFTVEGLSGDEFVSFSPFIAQAGSPRVAFQSTAGDDQPMVPGGDIYAAGGENSLTDGLRRTLDYLIDFSTPVSNFSLELYDFRGDGPHSDAILGVDSVELQVFGEDGRMLGIDSHVLPDQRPWEGNVVLLGLKVDGVHSARVHFKGIDGGTSIDNLRFEILDGAPRGDFNDDSILDAFDIDQLSDVVRAGTNDARFDLTGDTVVDKADRDAWVSVLKGTFYGDATLNGHVNANDLNALAINWQQIDQGWTAGDFTGDGVVDAQDLNLMGQYWERSRPIEALAIPVPEPMCSVFLMLALLLVRCFAGNSRPTRCF